ncbi:MAG: hypothetical protein J6V44_08105 [Methanobrevibacter sp.]|nr:hypothetical protein [Methanobrevibacter sp.]
MNNAIVVSETGWKAMGFSSDFKKYAREKGIRDPFEVSQRLFAKRIKRNEDGSATVRIEQDENGKILPDPEEPTRAEKDAYIMMRDEYIARRVFAEIGYEAFLDYTVPGRTYDISFLRDELFPCESLDEQCSMFCPKYAECPYKEGWGLE